MALTRHRGEGATEPGGLRKHRRYSNEPGVPAMERRIPIRRHRKVARKR